MLAWLAPVGDAGAEPLDIAVSVPVQAEWVKRIGGKHVRPRVVVPEGVLAENFTLGPNAIAGLTKADIYLAVGHPHFRFESVEVEPAVAAAGVPFVRLLEAGISEDASPRPWTSPRRVAAWLPQILEVLVELDVENANAYQSATEAFVADIEALDKKLTRQLSARRERTLVVTHPVWSAFCDDYGLDQLSLTRDGAELPARDLVPLIEGLAQMGVHTIFAHPRLSQRGAKLLSRQIGAEVVELDPDSVPWLANVRRTGELFLAALERR